MRILAKFAILFSLQVWAEPNIYFVQNDHLGTPQALYSNDATPQIVWRADYKPFGEATVNEDPDGDGHLVSMPIRFPGQYYDIETGLHYNYFRDYDPSLGRYVQSDPIGLAGGLNTYAYVDGNPVSFADFYGLSKAKAPGNYWSGSGYLGGGGKSCPATTSRAARRSAMRDRNVPTSRPTIQQRQYRDGTRQDVVRDSSGKPSVQTQHKADSKHPRDHWHSAPPKIDPVTGQTRKGQEGSTRYQTGGTVSTYD